MKKDNKKKWIKTVTRNYGFFHAIVQAQVLGSGFPGLTEWNCRESLCLMTEKNQCDIYLSEAAINRFFQIAKKEYKRGKYDHSFHQQLKKFCDDAFVYSKKIFQDDFHKLSNIELGKIYQNFLRYYPILYNVMVFSHHTSLALIENFRRCVEEKCGLDDFDKYLPALLTLERPTAAMLENNRRLSIARMVYKKNLLRSLKKKTLLIDIEKKFPMLIREIDNYLIDFGGIHMEYMNKSWSREDVIDYLSRFIKENTLKKIEEGLKDNDLAGKKNKEDKKRILRVLRLDIQERLLLKNINAFTYLFDFAKTSIVRCHYLNYPLFSEIGRRFNYKWREIMFMSPQEISTLFSLKIVSAKILQARQKSFGVLQLNRKIKIYQGEKTRQLRNKLQIKEVATELNNLIRGSVGFPGFIRGRACIINGIQDAGKLKKGDILIAKNTTTEYASFMGYASAFVTDEGGITCHAAIVSRELGIPCVIGTKIATKVLKDGDLVDVDANKGIVKIRTYAFE